MKYHWFSRLLAIFFGLSIFWGGGEVVSRLLFREKIQFDVEMWRYAREVKATGLTPGLRFEHRPGARARLMGVDVAINAAGLREREIPRSKPDNVVRIAVIGDSVTFGWGVAAEQTYPRQLEELLNARRPLGAGVAFEVLNFGVGNYGVGDVAAMLESKAVAYDPDLIVYGAFINDAEPTTTVAEDSLLRHSLFAVWLWGRFDALWRQLGWRADFRTYYNELYREDGPGRQLVRGGLQRMAKVSDERHAPLLVALLPELHAGADTVFLPVRNFYQQAAAEIDARFIDLHGALPVQGRERFWVSLDDAHPNADACRLYAHMLATALPWQELLAARRIK